MITNGSRSAGVKPMDVVYGDFKAAEKEAYCTLYMQD